MIEKTESQEVWAIGPMLHPSFLGREKVAVGVIQLEVQILVIPERRLGKLAVSVAVIWRME